MVPTAVEPELGPEEGWAVCKGGGIPCMGMVAVGWSKTENVSQSSAEARRKERGRGGHLREWTG